MGRRYQLKEQKMNTLDAGIQETVAFLRWHGFKTTDSGDGDAKFADGDPPEGAIPFPHVAIIAEPGAMIAEADRLRDVLNGAGVTIGEIGPDETAPVIQATYDPADGTATIMLLGVNDATLAAAKA